jgi:hypothetical protein
MIKTKNPSRYGDSIQIKTFKIIELVNNYIDEIIKETGNPPSLKMAHAVLKENGYKITYTYLFQLKNKYKLNLKKNAHFAFISSRTNLHLNRIIKFCNEYKEVKKDSPTKLECYNALFLKGKYKITKARFYAMCNEHNLNDMFKIGCRRITKLFKENSVEWLKVYNDIEKILLRYNLIRIRNKLKSHDAYEIILKEYKYFSQFPSIEIKVREFGSIKRKYKPKKNYENLNN